MAFTDDTYNSPGLSEAAGFSFWIKELPVVGIRPSQFYPSPACLHINFIILIQVQKQN